MSFNFFKKLRKAFLMVGLSFTLLLPTNAKADMWGGDLVFLAQLVTNAVQQLVQLKQIFSTGRDTLGLFKDINRGLKDGLAAIQMIDPRFKPGMFGNLHDVDQILGMIEELYGEIPATGESKVQEAQDQTAAESMAMNTDIFKFADDADKETKRIMNHSAAVNPQGAQKLTNQSIAILISVSTQVLRTNSMMLKLLGQEMAVINKKEKLESKQFKMQYEGLSSAFSKVTKSPKLSPLSL